ncbi:MAG: TraR/DksA C4-type zinc finger protein [Anaerolineae bacterium]|nr:TraR/DksA C4-type zinc finger protein [Anaerolineae bacterium]
MHKEQRMADLKSLLEQSAALHNHLCPRQVIGVRMGLFAGQLLGLEVPQANKRLITFIETDGCFADGVAVATGCWLGHRTLRLIDEGKVAATFVDSETSHAIRLAPSPQVRELARELCPNAKSRWHAQLEAYQVVSDEAFFVWQEIELHLNLDALISRPGIRVNCARCGEEILNEREVYTNGQPLCRSCAGESYFKVKSEAAWLSINLAEPSIICESH